MTGQEEEAAGGKIRCDECKVICDVMGSERKGQRGETEKTLNAGVKE